MPSLSHVELQKTDLTQTQTQSRAKAKTDTGARLTWDAAKRQLRTREGKAKFLAFELLADSVFYYRDRAGTPRGPCTVPTLRKAWAAGLIDEFTLVWGAGLRTWVPIRNAMGVPALIRTLDTQMLAAYNRATYIAWGTQRAKDAERATAKSVFAQVEPEAEKELAEAKLEASEVANEFARKYRKGWFKRTREFKPPQAGVDFDGAATPASLSMALSNMSLAIPLPGC